MFLPNAYLELMFLQRAGDLRKAGITRESSDEAIKQCIYEITLRDFVTIPDVILQNTNILDLGCGLGFLGIMILQNSNSIVHFLDKTNTKHKPDCIPKAFGEVGNEQFYTDLSSIEFIANKYEISKDRYRIINDKDLYKFDAVISFRALCQAFPYKLYKEYLQKTLVDDGLMMVDAVDQQIEELIQDFEILDIIEKPYFANKRLLLRKK